MGVDAQSLQQFLKDSPWEARCIWRTIRKEVVPRLEPITAIIVDESGWVKQGEHSVGVSPQYCGSVGKKANCQVSVEVVVSDGEIAAPIAGRLYLPESWTNDTARCREVGVPKDIQFQTKPEIALELIEEAVKDGAPRAPVLGDAVYGDNGKFREGLRKNDLEFFLQIDPSKHKGWEYEVAPAQRKNSRGLYVSRGVSATKTVQEMVTQLPKGAWTNARWKSADGKARATRIACFNAWLQHPLRNKGGVPERVLVVVDWPVDSPRPYHVYFAHLSRAPSIPLCLKLSRTRWEVEFFFLRAKQELGLDHYEGRSWQGFHHHLVLCALAYLTILLIHLEIKKILVLHGNNPSKGSAPFC